MLELALANTATVPAGREIAREDEEPTSLFFLLSGMVSRYKVSHSGRRQILSLMLPGDSCDLGITILERRDHSLLAMTECVLARLSDGALEHIAEQYPKIKAALRWATLVEEAISREWILNGSREAEKRTAHLVYEVYNRLHAIGLADAPNFHFPLTQTDMADTLGISAVHANRVLQALRRQKLIAFGDKRMTILDTQRLHELGEFDDTYLHLDARYEQARRMVH